MNKAETFLTAHQVIDRWNGVIKVGTLANWRARRVGPSFVKLRGRVLYPLDKIVEWEASNYKEIGNDNNEQTKD